MNYAVKDLGKKSYEITVTVPWDEVKKTYGSLLEQTVKNAEISGFRKGKAPKELVEKNLNKDVFYEEVLNAIVKDNYPHIVKEKNFQPIILPHVEILAKDEDKDWIYKITICEKPEVDLGNYKEELGKISAKVKIWLPGKGDKEKNVEEDKNKRLNDALAKIMEIANVELPDPLVADETAKLLAELLEEIKKLGLSLEQYLLSTRKSLDGLKDEYRQKAINSLKLEFALSQVADTENISVSNEEIEEALKDVSDNTLKEQLKNSSYQLAALLRRQKTLDFIASL